MFVVNGHLFKIRRSRPFFQDQVQKFQLNLSIPHCFKTSASRIVDIAPHYYDLEYFLNCEAKHVLEKLYKDESRNRR
ncbi:hypothetical protein L1987_13041 [Smallanthus sonchifolius]|uniref:Uncharacterized protein n=1 Tax=Smallanthus sonchifolius TaxID=185202 RepID=A0ACB9JGD1_9ASTR|nr:hypothetical protein L1987_13041 [Smallanthus sonchifolius]